MIITHKLQPMDLTHKQNTSRVDVVQDDKYSRDIEFTLTENGIAWQIPDGATAVVRYKKPDGTGGNYDTLPDGSTAYQINGNVLTVALAPQVCTVPGLVQLSVGLIKGNEEINTFTVNIVVQPNPGATYQSEDYIKLSGAVPNSGWTPNMYLGTDASGNVVAKEGTSGGGSTSGKDGVGIQSVEQTTTSTEDGGTNIVTVTKTDGTSSTFQVKNGSKGSTGQAGTNGKSAYQYAQDGGYTGTESEFAAKMAEEMPEALPNPNALTFTGAVTGSYDGSVPVSMEIPIVGGSSGFRLVRDLTLTESAESVIINSDDDGNPFSLSECLIHIFAQVTEAGKIVYIPNGYYAVGTYFNSTTTTATDYAYDFGAYSVGSEEMFFGYETKARSVAPTQYYNAERNKNPSLYFNKITSYRIDAKFDAGARFFLYGRDA